MVAVEPDRLTACPGATTTSPTFKPASAKTLTDVSPVRMTETSTLSTFPAVVPP
jgi:hypothetical protein